jgi:KAP family P-loop domain
MGIFQMKWLCKFIQCFKKTDGNIEMTNTNLKLLDDLPVASAEDNFHHSVYASIIRDVFLSNKPGLSIGLFGKWGQGKSSIVKALQESLAGDATVIIFNAWKASGDSVRRQLLLEILKKIAPKKAKELKRFVGLEIIESLLLTEKEKKNKKTKAKLETFLDYWLWVKMFLPVVGLCIFLLCGLLACLLSLIDFWARGDYWLSLALGIFFPSMIWLTVYVLKTVKQRYYGRLSISQPLSESQKLQYPEQFQEVLEKYVRLFCKENGRLIVVIDDLDRCNAETVAEALAAIRQFTMDQVNDPTDFSCQFLVPCDEQQVVLALESAGHDAGNHGARYHDYQSEELLRKFFDVVIRMDEMLQEDLSDYAANLAGEIGLEEVEAREIVGLSGARDPRQIKKLLNALKVSHENINRRVGPLLPTKEQMVDLPETQRLLVVLREIVPIAYKLVVANSSLIKGFSDEELDTQGLDDEKQKNTQLLKANRIIENAGSVSEATATMLIYGSLSPFLRKVPTGGLLTSMLMADNEEGFSDAFAATPTESKGNVKAWLRHKIRAAKSTANERSVLRLLFAHIESAHKGAAENIAPCVDMLFKETRSLADLLSNFKRYGALGDVWPTLQPESKSDVIAATYKNFKKDRAKANPELSFLLCHAKELDLVISSDLRKWMEDEAGSDTNGEAFEGRLRAILNSDNARGACYGFAPEVAIVLAGRPVWPDDSPEEDTRKLFEMPREQLIASLVGENSSAAWDAMLAIIGPEGQLASPTPLKNATSGVNSAWMAIGELAKVINTSKSPELFVYIQAWLKPQVDSVGTQLVLSAVLPLILYFPPEELGAYISGKLWANPVDLWLLDYVGKSPENTEMLMPWKSLTGQVFTQLSKQMQAPALLNESQNKVMDKIVDLGWCVQEESDQLLGLKIGQLPAQGTPQHIQKWVKILSPLMGNDCPHTSEAIRDLLKSRKHINEALQAGTAVVWRETIASEDALSIANMCKGVGNKLPEYIDSLSPIMEIKGSARVVTLCVDLLKNDQEWMKQHDELLAFLAKHLSKAEKVVQKKYQELIKLLIISDDDAAIKCGLTVLEQCDQIDDDVMKEVNLRAESQDDNIKKLAESVQKRETTS